MSGTRCLSTFGLCLLVAVIVVSEEDCDKTKCMGPIAFYEDIKCKPVYEKEGDCCAVRYDCSHLNGRSADKCYANGREYSVGEKLNDEDRNSACDIGCTCSRGFDGNARFSCAVVDCFHGAPKEECYFKRDPDSCCGEQVCPDSGKEIAKCFVDGYIYMDGQEFSDKDNPSLTCHCMEGYKGQNVEPFCKNITFTCGTELRHNPEILENCAPVYYSSQAPTTSCSVFYRCQNSKDSVIPSQDTPDVEVSEDMICKFGNMTMRMGDELNQSTDYSSVCVKCVCELPPTPTCQRLPDEECDVTVHPNFEIQ